MAKQKYYFFDSDKTSLFFPGEASFVLYCLASGGKEKQTLLDF